MKYSQISNSRKKFPKKILSTSFVCRSNRKNPQNSAIYPKKIVANVNEFGIVDEFVM